MDKFEIYFIIYRCHLERGPNLTVITNHDYQLADVYFAILIGFAANKQSISFSELVNLSKLKYGKNPKISKALSHSTGRPLIVISDFCQSIDAPDLALLVDANTTKNKELHKVEWLLNTIYEYNWENATSAFQHFIESKKHYSKPVAKNQTVREKEAAHRLMKEFYESHKKVLPQDIHKHEEEILQQLIAGKSASDAYQEVME